MCLLLHLGIESNLPRMRMKKEKSNWLGHKATFLVIKISRIISGCILTISRSPKKYLQMNV